MNTSSMLNKKALIDFFDYDKGDIEYENVVNNLDITDLEEGVEIIFNYWRKKGFPHYTVREDEKHSTMQKLRKFDVGTIFNDHKITQTMHALRLAWTYFPHWVDVRCGNAQRTPMETFLDDDRFRSVIRKCWKFCSTTYKGENEGTKNIFHENRLRQTLRIYTGTQAVSNFRPTAAKFIYEKYGGDVIWDMSAGWGGRLLGFLASSRKKYIGTEPSTKTFRGLKEIKKDFCYINKDVELYKLGSELFEPDRESLDLCFTSPPYFDTEKYSDEDTQSYVKFPTKDKWIDGFLKKTIENCYRGLKQNKYMLINIANTPKYKFIEEETVRISKELGFKQEKTVELTLSSVMGAGHKYEPIFVFKKC